MKFNTTFEDHIEKKPTGVHKSTIKKVELARNKKDNGDNFIIDLQIVEGEFKGEIIRTWVTFNNPNITAQNIGRRNMTDICKQVGLNGLSELEDSDQLVGKIFKIEYAQDGDFSIVKNFNPKDVEPLNDSIPF